MIARNRTPEIGAHRAMLKCGKKNSVKFDRHPMLQNPPIVAAALLLATFSGRVANADENAPELTSGAEATNSSKRHELKVPQRLASAVGGREFIREIRDLGLEQREAAIFREITSGNFPQFLCRLKSIPIRGGINAGNRELDIASSIEVMPDYLAVGSDEDFVRMPMTPQTAQRIADEFGCMLPTRKIVDAIDAHAELHLDPRPLTHEREAAATFLQHHGIIEDQRAGTALGMLVVGTKKDIVLSPRIFERPNRLAIYGWRQLDGRPIQPLTTVHSNRYVDYSHGVRLVRDAITLDDQTKKISDMLADPSLCALVSDEGVINPPRYPLD